MKRTITHLFPLLLTLLCTIFALFLLLGQSSDSTMGIFTKIGSHFGNISQKDNVSSVAEKAEALEKVPLPTPNYVGESLLVGDVHSFADLFTLKFADGTTSTLRETPNTALYLMDVKMDNGTSVLTKLSSFDQENSEEIPSAAVYDTQNHLLSFHQSGIYTLSLQLYYDHRPGVFFVCRIPVEVR